MGRDENNLADDARSLELLAADECVSLAMDESDLVLERDACWLAWHEEAGSRTYHNSAAIRDRWNGLTNQQRRAIAPRAWQRLGTGPAARETVKHAVLRAKEVRRT